MLIADMFDKICSIAKEIDAAEEIETKLWLTQKISAIVNAIDHISRVSYEAPSTPESWHKRDRKWF